MFAEDTLENLNYALARPLLILQEDNGFLACAYINVETCNKTGEACAIVSGVNNHEEMKQAKVIAVSESAHRLGVRVGDSGSLALEKMR